MDRNWFLDGSILDCLSKHKRYVDSRMPSLYDLLGVSKDADTNEIKKAFKRAAMTHHPDKGGDAEKFKEIQKAHEILTDDRRRQVYDMTGSEDGEQQMGGGGMGGFPFDIGGMFGGLGGMFGGMGGGRGPRVVRRPKAPPKVTEIPLKLHDFYHGRTFQVKFERQKFCETCKGQGATSFQTCSTCQGNGTIRQHIQMGPMVMINEGPCNDCQGEGKKASGNCYVCGGKKTKPQEKELTVKIDPGMKPGESLIFQKECSDDPNFDEPGDVHFVLQEAAGDEGWIRRGDDLETQVTVSFQESLLGCKKMFQGHPGFFQGLEVEIPIGTENGKVVTVTGKGMPKKGSNEFGVLRIRVTVTVTEKDRELLQRNAPLIQAMFAS
jgi:DnaJ family protein A protein 2